MDSYIELQLKPDAEMSEAELSSKVFIKFHKALVQLNTNQIGVSFPKTHVKLGRVFRIHGQANLLSDLQGLEWLGALSGYCQLSGILSVPDKVQHRIVTVRRGNMSGAKLRRLIARGSIDKEGEKRYKVKMLSQGFDNPYLDISSSSSGQTYRKFFEFGEPSDVASEGVFDTFGLSKTATVPWF